MLFFRFWKVVFRVRKQCTFGVKPRFVLYFKASCAIFVLLTIKQSMCISKLVIPCEESEQNVCPRNNIHPTVWQSQASNHVTNTSTYVRGVVGTFRNHTTNIIIMYGNAHISEKYVNSKAGYVTIGPICRGERMGWYSQHYAQSTRHGRHHNFSRKQRL